jgi:1,4-dihydroxy-2-naphthoate octaprenyltransferase
MGRDRARRLYSALVWGAYGALPVALFAGDGPWWPLVALASLPLAPFEAVRSRTDGPSLNGALADTGRLLAVFSLLVSAGLLLD